MLISDEQLGREKKNFIERKTPSKPRAIPERSVNANLNENQSTQTQNTQGETEGMPGNALLSRNNVTQTSTAAVLAVFAIGDHSDRQYNAMKRDSEKVIVTNSVSN
ncbi:hypothetical protein FGB62_119g013 [Gracilaria domingensis]|nr:hypothetical protein FGB62_119g013 [Gracilaria domingensis]